MPRTLIIGYGNPLRGDDGAGHVAAERLRPLLADRADVEVMSVHQPVPELAEAISGAERVVFIDAAVNLAPGSVQVVPVEAGRDGPGPTTHHFSPPALLELARGVFGKAPKAWIVAIGATDFEYREELSPAVAAAVDQAVQITAGLVRG